MEVPTREPAATLPAASDNPTDLAIRRLLARGSLPTAQIALQLALSERTIRYRLARLRDAGAVTWDEVGRYRLAGPELPPDRGLAAPALPAASGLADPDQDPSSAAASPELDGVSSGWTVVAVVAAVAAAAFGLGWYMTRAPSPPAPQPVAPQAPWQGTGLYPGRPGW